MINQETKTINEDVNINNVTNSRSTFNTSTTNNELLNEKKNKIPKWLNSSLK